MSVSSPGGCHFDTKIWPHPTAYRLQCWDCCCSVAKSCPTLCNPWTATCQASLSITIPQSWLKLMFIKSVMPSNHLILCHPLLLLPSIFHSIRVFSSVSVLCHQVAKVLELYLQHQSFTLYNRLQFHPPH